MTLLHLQQITIRCSKDQKLTLRVLLLAPTKISDKLDISVGKNGDVKTKWRFSKNQNINVVVSFCP